MFSEAYKNLCVENAEKLREEWEPKFGDWVKTRHGIGVISEVVASTVLVSHCYKVVYQQGGENYPAKEDMAPLLTPRQLMRMLEERGKIWRCGEIDPIYQPKWAEEGLIEEEDWYWASIRPEYGDKKRIIHYGPDPETSLLKALMEVMKDDIQSDLPTSP